MPIEITERLVEDIARLSRLSLTPDEKGELHGHFEKILRYVESLDTLDTSKVDPSIFPHETSNVMRPDEARESLPVDEALRNAPATRDGFFIVPRIIQDAP